MILVKKILFCFIISLLISTFSFSSEIGGTVKDGNNNETMIGATVMIKELKVGVSSGLDGSFRIKNIPKGNYTVICSFIGYNAQEQKIVITSDNEKIKLGFSLQLSVNEINEVTVVAHKDQSTETSARESERSSANVLNVVSAKSIELSPDVDVASVVQRMSGVTLDKSSSSNGQYALLRGMDKRYNYTLVNGIQIPSTSNSQRYVSLDIFPSDLVDRIEVSKVLTSDMEGDAIAGAINLIMKNAPDKLLVQANASIGYNDLWQDVPFLTFSKKAISEKSPYELNGIKYKAVPTDFPKSNLNQQQVNNPLNKTYGITIGDRHFKKKFGWILAASYNDNYKGKSSLIFGEDQSTDGKNLPVVTSMLQRKDYDHQVNYGLHSKLDFAFTPKHDIQLYTAFMNFNLIQVRDQEITELGNNSYDPINGSKNMTHSDRNRLNIQNLFTTTLQGDHTLIQNLTIQWSASYSKANNQSPDNATITYDKTYVNTVLRPEYVDFGGSDRLWLHNSDEDKAGYANLKYNCKLYNGKLELKVGGLYRNKKRDSFYNDYTLIPLGPKDAHTAKDVDWINYSDINWTVKNPLGAVNTAGTYNAYETVFSKYGMLTYEKYRFKIIGGVRFEDTKQGYDQVFHNILLDKLKPGNNQKRDHINQYLLPSINMQYNISEKNNIKVSYYQAINKPSFLEIVPYIDNTGDYAKTGNSDLKNALANNYDIRYEYLPNKLDQVLIGTFYKKIANAIEEGFVVDGHGNYNLTFQNSDATNYGFEADVIKFFRQIGVKANYTWTYSETSSSKRSQVNGVLNRDSTVSSMQTRPLCGQSKNVGNISLLYKGTHNGFNAQLALSYTGNRIYKVSPDLNGDLWQKSFWQLDLSAEKKFKHGLGIFIKAHNLLNTHTIVYIKQKNTFNNDFPNQDASSAYTLIRDEYSKRSYLIGIRYKL